MERLTRVTEIILLFAAVAYGVMITQRWVEAEKLAAYRDGLWHGAYEGFQLPETENPKRLKKW